MTTVLAGTTLSSTGAKSGVGGAITELDKHRDHRREAVRRRGSAAIEIGAATSRSRGRDATGLVLASPASISPTTNDMAGRAVCAEHYRRWPFASWEF